MAPSVTQQLYENVVLQSEKITFPVFGWPHQIFFRNFNFFFFIKLSGFKGQNNNIWRFPKKSKNFSISNFSPTIVTEMFLAPSVTQQLYENVVLQSKKITFPVFGWPHQIFLRNFNFFFFIKLSGFKGQNNNIWRFPKKSKIFQFQIFLQL